MFLNRKRILWIRFYAITTGNTKTMNSMIKSNSRIFHPDLWITTLLLLYPAFFFQVNAQPVKGVFEKTIDYRKFSDPPVDYRSFPFFSMNDSLNAEEMKVQVRDFSKAGFGGFYLHSRDGLLTEFLGNEWWINMNAAVEAAQESGIHAMFYDEDKWPSGYAGGIIPRMSEDFRAKSLVRLKKETPLPAGSIILKEDSQFKYIQHTAPMGNPIFNGTSWVDLFNPEMVAKFLDVAYRPYIEKFSGKIQNYHFAIFADEPHIHARYFDRATPNQGILSYSPWVAKKFREMNGYDFLDKVNLLFEEKENWREVRLQYFRAVAEQFDESFAKQISQYCEKNGVKFTGHYLGEDGLEKVRDRIGNSMLHYRWMQQPGMDLLGLSIAGRLLTARSLSSVANQYATPMRLTELFGISGQNMNFEDRKWIAGWHCILGINHFCPHLTLYSMKGLRKRDYPPTFSYQQPYWPYNKKIEDYLGRISYAATVGKYVPQILVINPLESEYIKGNNDGEFTAGVQVVMEFLQAHHYGYDLGDEQILADTAVVTNHKLVVGDMAYEQVILPGMISIRESTIDLLLQLHKKGGLIFSFGRFPEYVGGFVNNKKLEALKNAVIRIKDIRDAAELTEKVNPHLRLSGKDSPTVWTQVRTTSNGALILLFNTSHTQSANVMLNSDFIGKKAVLWNPSSGKCFGIKPDKTGSFPIELAASEVLWITSGKMNKTIQTSGLYALPKPETIALNLKNDWQGKRLAPNAITLDFASYSSDGGKSFSDPEPVICIFARLSDQQFRGNLRLQYAVQIDEIPKSCKLVLEQPDMYKTISLNGKLYSFKADGFYADHQFKTSVITDHLKKGKNTIELELDFKPAVDTSSVAKERYGSEIESIYLTGDFAVSAHDVFDFNASQRNQAGTFQSRPVHQAKSFSISGEKTQFEGDISTEGYPFYAGAFELKQTFNLPEKLNNSSYFLELPNCEAIVTVIELNGTVIDTLCWSPYKTDISKALKAGKNELKITIVNSLRNLLGPHHHNQGELIEVGPKSFTGAGGFPDGGGDARWYDLRKTTSSLKIWTDTYNFIPFGLLEPVKISVR
jgi:hypothetical protein